MVLYQLVLAAAVRWLYRYSRYTQFILFHRSNQFEFREFRLSSL